MFSRCSAFVWQSSRIIVKNHKCVTKICWISDTKEAQSIFFSLCSSHSHKSIRVPFALFMIRHFFPPGPAASLRSDCFSAGALFFARLMLRRSTSQGFKIGFNIWRWEGKCVSFRRCSVFRPGDALKKHEKAFYVISKLDSKGAKEWTHVNLIDLV